MKLSITLATILVALLFATTFVTAQHVSRSSLNFESVPPNTSPEEDLSFENTGSNPLTLNINVSGSPFVLAENRCGKGVKPHSHCNLYLTYTAQSIGEADNGTLTIDYGSGVVTVQLAGAGVEWIATTSHLGPAPRQCVKVHLGDSFSMHGTVDVPDKYYALPTGEPVDFTCTNGSETVDLGSVPLTLCKRCPGGPHDQADDYFTPDQVGNWKCTMKYDGDGILGPTSADVDLIVGTGYKRRRCG